MKGSTSNSSPGHGRPDQARRNAPTLQGDLKFGPLDYSPLLPTPPATLNTKVIDGLDKFMNECRAITNLIGNGVASVVVSKWEGELDLERAKYFLDNPKVVEEEEYQMSLVPPGAGIPYEA